MNVTLYSSPTCGYCHQAERYLTERGINFTKYDVSADPVSARRMVELTGQRGVPVITVDDQVIIGFDRPRLDRLLANGNGRARPSFGLRITDASKVANPGEQTIGAYVDRVTPGTPGERAGLRHGDIITRVNSHPIQNSAELAKTLASLTGGHRTTIDFVRGNEILESTVET